MFMDHICYEIYPSFEVLCSKITKPHEQESGNIGYNGANFGRDMKQSN
jgi:hypothetical protein